jgi:hypothetical protein
MYPTWVILSGCLTKLADLWLAQPSILLPFEALLMIEHGREYRIFELALWLKVLKDTLVEIRGALRKDRLNYWLQVEDSGWLGWVQFCPYTYEVQYHLLLGLVHAMNKLLWLLP